jgi:hypothetical protein
VPFYLLDCFIQIIVKDVYGPLALSIISVIECLAAPFINNKANEQYKQTCSSGAYYRNSRETANQVWRMKMGR